MLEVSLNRFAIKVIKQQMQVNFSVFLLKGEKCVIAHFALVVIFTKW